MLHHFEGKCLFLHDVLSCALQRTQAPVDDVSAVCAGRKGLDAQRLHVVHQRYQLVQLSLHGDPLLHQRCIVPRQLCQHRPV